MDLINFGRVEQLPLAVGSLLGVLALGTLAHLLVTSIRRRRVDLAVLKVLGFVPGQVRRTVVWQASTIAAVALAFGLPLGVVLGRLIWFLFAHQLGVVAAPTVPPLRLTAVVLGGLVVTGLVAIGAGLEGVPDPGRRYPQDRLTRLIQAPTRASQMRRISSGLKSSLCT